MNNLIIGNLMLCFPDLYNTIANGIGDGEGQGYGEGSGNSGGWEW